MTAANTGVPEQEAFMKKLECKQYFSKLPNENNVWIMIIF